MVLHAGDRRLQNIWRKNENIYSVNSYISRLSSILFFLFSLSSILLNLVLNFKQPERSCSDGEKEKVDDTCAITDVWNNGLIVNLMVLNLYNGYNREKRKMMDVSFASFWNSSPLYVSCNCQFEFYFAHFSDDGVNSDKD